MKDNLSIVILMILFVLVMVMFPLYNYFERQDDMSYNLALKATTNFVDEVLSSGYIDQDMYNKFIDQLSATGNLYDVQLEAHRSYKIKDPDSSREVYIEKSLIDYNDDIFAPISGQENSVSERQILNNIYKLDEGDEFYVKLKNSTTTMAGAIFNAIITTSSKDRIVVNYGGVVKNNSWEMVDATFNEKFASDSIYYVENDSGDDFYATVYFKGLSNVSYNITVGKFNGSCVFVNASGTKSNNKTITTSSSEVIRVDKDGVLLVKGKGKNVEQSNYITLVNSKTGVEAKLVKYESDYASKDNLILDMEREYKYLKIWPTLANIKIDNPTISSNITTTDDAKEDAEVYKTTLKRNWSENGQKSGSTLEIVFAWNDRSKKQYLVGDWEKGGGGILYVPPSGINGLSDTRLAGVSASDKGKMRVLGVIAGEIYSVEKGDYIWVRCPAPESADKTIKLSFTNKYDSANDETTIALYLNGVLQESRTFKGKIGAPKRSSDNTQVEIGLGGNLQDKSPYYWQPLYGRIESIQIYNKALTEDEVKENYSISLFKYQL